MPFASSSVARYAGPLCCCAVLMILPLSARTARAQVVVRERVEVTAPLLPDVLSSAASGSNAFRPSVDRHLGGGMKTFDLV